jgi:Streptomyces sporulation and cell division protein, SsgA
MATGRHTASSLRTDTAMVLVSGIGGTPVHAELRYRCDDPFAVQLRLSIPGSQLVIWTVGRDLLSTVSPSPTVWVTCTSIPPAAASSSNSARRHPPRGWSPTGAALQAFLAAAASPVPPGTEIDHYTLDEELLRIQHG